MLHEALYFRPTSACCTSGGNNNEIASNACAETVASGQLTYELHADRPAYFTPSTLAYV
jgi:hypothetical protein